VLEADERIPVCSFCGKGQARVKKLVAGSHRVFICNECVELPDHDGRRSYQTEAVNPGALTAPFVGSSGTYSTRSATVQASALVRDAIDQYLTHRK
jgi:ATP-dependent protease Clp ATPase subunit